MSYGSMIFQRMLYLFVCLFCFFLENSICDCTDRWQRQSDLGVQVIMVTSAERLFVIRHCMRSQRWKMSVILSEGKEGATLCVRKATSRWERRRSFALFWQTVLPPENPPHAAETQVAPNNQNGQQVSGLRCPQESSSAGGWHRAVRSCQRPTQQNASTRWALVTQPGPGRFMSLGTILCFLWNVWPDPLGARHCYFSITPMTFIFFFLHFFCFFDCGQNLF